MTIGPRRNNCRIYFNLAKEGFTKIKRKRRKDAINRLGPVYDRVNQTGSVLGSNLVKAGFDLGAKAWCSEFGKKLINKGIDNIPNIFRFGASKIKNENVKRALNSEIADLVVNDAKVELGRNIIVQTCSSKKMGGISNYQIEKAFKKIDDEDLLNNFLGVFPSNYMSKFINHAAMIEDAGKYPFIIANTDAADKPGQYWWSILDIEPRTDIFFLIRMELKDWNIS